MKVVPFLLFAAICLLVILGRPDQVPHRPGRGPQMEEARQEEEYQEEKPTNGIRVVFKVSKLEQEPIADIIWLKKAADVALENGTSYFNVLEQNVSRRFVRKENIQLSVIDGFIKLETDPMTAEYDANEIAELVITDYSL